MLLPSLAKLFNSMHVAADIKPEILPHIPAAHADGSPGLQALRALVRVMTLSAGFTHHKGRGEPEVPVVDGCPECSPQTSLQSLCS